MYKQSLQVAAALYTLAEADAAILCTRSSVNCAPQASPSVVMLAYQRSPALLAQTHWILQWVAAIQKTVTEISAWPEFLELVF